LAKEKVVGVAMFVILLLVVTRVPVVELLTVLLYKAAEYEVAPGDAVMVREPVVVEFVNEMTGGDE
jgi:hypothetical protein